MAEREVNIVGDCLRSNTSLFIAGVSFDSLEWAAANALFPHPTTTAPHTEALRSRAASSFAEWETSLGKSNIFPTEHLYIFHNPPLTFGNVPWGRAPKRIEQECNEAQSRLCCQRVACCVASRRQRVGSELNERSFFD